MKMISKLRVAQLSFLHASAAVSALKIHSGLRPLAPSARRMMQDLPSKLSSQSFPSESFPYASACHNVPGCRAFSTGWHPRGKATGWGHIRTVSRQPSTLFFPGCTPRRPPFGSLSRVTGKASFKAPKKRDNIPIPLPGDQRVFVAIHHVEAVPGATQMKTQAICEKNPKQGPGALPDGNLRACATQRAFGKA